MSLIICPECGHEVSSSAAACTNCGHPFVKPVVQRNVVVSEIPRERDDFPKWIFIPLGLLGIVLLFILLAYMRNSSNDDAQNINVRIASQPSNSLSARTTTTTESAPPNQIVVPPSQTGQVVVPPSSSSMPVAPPPTITTVAPPTEGIVPDKGTVNLEAKVATASGSTLPVKAERFYLLNKDLDSVLSEANIEDETGQGLTNAFGLSVVFPDKYSDTRTRALAAIGKHTVYKTQTDANGKAQIKGIKPDNYYLFGITKTKTGFAVWSSPVTIQAGDNSLVLPAAQMTEISQE